MGSTMKSPLRPFIALVAAMALLLGACGDDVDDSSADNGTTAGGAEFVEEYTALNGQRTQSGASYLDVDLPTDHIFEYAEEDEIRQLLEDGDGVIYFGFPSCPWCRNAVGPLDEAGKAADLEQINYVNPSTMRDQAGSNEYYQLLLAELGEFAPEHPQQPGQRTILVPLVATVVDGDVVAAHLGSAPSQTDPSQALTESQRAELLEIYSSHFSQIP